MTISRVCDQCGAEHGRPRVPDSGFEVSVSHSNDVVALAITDAGPVGVDVEWVREDLDFQPLLRRVCAAEEQTAVHDAFGFYRCWTRKESVLKATGVGLAADMATIVVSSPSETPALISYGSGRLAGAQMAELVPFEGYTAAVTVLCHQAVDFDVADPDGPLRGQGCVP